MKTKGHKAKTGCRLFAKKKKIAKKGETTAKDLDKKPTYETLDDVVDTTKLFTMIYSGVEQEAYFNTLYDLGIRNFLMSYHYLQKGGINPEVYKKLNGEDTRLFIDSGAYTYRVNEEYASYTAEQWEKQIVRYLNWARKHKDTIFAIADLDLQEMVGIDTVYEWRRKYFEPFMLETGIPVCFIWHNCEGFSGWEKTCERYPYVGVSFTTDELEHADKWLRVAEKYHAVVHGMGMTQTKELTKLPLFTCDSTTWLVGLKYGEVNYWRGNKMSRLKKDKWKGEYLNKILGQFSSYGLDRDKLLAEDTQEMIKVNVLAFIEAEKFIRDKLKSKMYWLKKISVKQSIEDIAFPPPQWLDGDRADWKDYAVSLNINSTDISDTLGRNLVCDSTCFINWDKEEYQEFIKEVYTPELISQLHDLYINRIVPSDEERIEDLRKFFTECVEGKNDKLLVLGTNFDRVAKDRDNYVEDEVEEEIVDVPLENLKDLLPPSLPSGTGDEELDRLEEEIRKDTGIQLVRDDKGRFVKGQKAVRKPKKMYSGKYPKLACNSCYGAQTCPEYKEGYVCAYNKLFQRFDTRNQEDIMVAMQSMSNMNMERLQKAMIFENLDGGMPTGTVSNLINQNMALLNQMARLNEMKSMETVRKTTVVNSDGSTSETLQVHSNATGGVLEKLLSSCMNTKKEETETPKKVDIKEEDIVEEQK